MNAGKPNSISLRHVLWFAALALVLAAFAARSSPALADMAAARFGIASQTVLAARIEPAAHFEIVAEYGGRVQSIDAATGASVQAGSALLTLENAEFAAETLAATRRMELAALHLRLAESKGSSGAVEREHSTLASQDRAAAQERLNEHSLVSAERAAASARKRATEVRALLRQGLATAAEVENAQVAEAAASRDLDAAREHRSRLRQELAQAESRLRVVQFQSPRNAAALVTARSEFDEAQAAVAILRERMKRLQVTSPGNGTVLEILARPGEFVSAGRTVARVADLTSLRISAPVSAHVAQSIPAGKRVRVRLPLDPPKQFDVQVSEVTRIPDAVQQVYFVRAIVRNPEPSTVLVGLEAAMEIDHLDWQ